MKANTIWRSIDSLHLLKAVTVVGALLIATAAALAWTELTATANVINHPSVVPETPRRDTPIVLDGAVWKSVQIQDRVVVAGEFTQVETVRGGPIVNRSNIFAYDINTGEIIDDFAPQVNNAVFDVVVDNADNTLYLGGRFTQIDGQWRQRLAKLDYSGQLDPNFTAEASAQVYALVLGDGELYLGGSFLTVNGQTHDSIAAVDTTTGNNVADFNYQIRGNLGKGETRSVRALDINSANNRLYVAFAGQSIVDNNGVAHDRYGVGIIDLSRNVVTAYRTAWFENAHPRCSSGALQIRDAELSPDETTFVVVEKGDFECDKIVAFPAFGDGSQVDPLWVTAAHDSVFSVGIANNTVYAGGHFCFLTAHGPVTSAQAATYPWVKKPVSCEIGQGNTDVGTFLARQQIVALDIRTGAVLDWNPTTNSLVGVFDIEPIERGLLLGQDDSRVNQIRTGRHAFLDFGSTTPATNPLGGQSLSCAVAVNGATASITWNDLPGVSTYNVRSNDRWVATVNGTSFNQSGLDAGNYSYTVRYRQGGETITVACSPTIVGVGGGTGQAGTCTVSNQGVIQWSSVDGVSDYQIRKNGVWLAGSQALTFTDNTFNAGDTYLVRYRQAGVVTNVPCA